MKTITISLLLAALVSCTDAGTIQKIDKGNNDQIEVYEYFYDDGFSVYVARFKDNPNVVSTTWTEHRGRYSVKKGSVTIFENDSIQVIFKNQTR